MRALVLPALDGPGALRIEERPAPEPGEGEVLVRIRAAALNFPDVLMTTGGYQFRPPLPFVPGMEAAGDVIATGAGADGFVAGDKVIVKLRYGALQEQVCVPAGALSPLPTPYDYAEGAAFGVIFQTGQHALFDRGRLAAGETLLVHGAAGGVGMAAVDLGLLAGARVIATAAGAAKAEILRARGVAQVIDYREGFREAVLDLTGGRGVDVVFDPVGGPVFRDSLRCLAYNGRLLVIGFTSGEHADFTANYALVKSISVIGVRAGEHGRREPEAGRRNRAHIQALAEAGSIRPHISHRLPLERTAEAMQAMLDRAVIGKAVIDLA